MRVEDLVEASKKSFSLYIRVSKRDHFLDFEFAHWTDSVFWCKTKNISRIFHSGLVWGWTSPKTELSSHLKTLKLPVGESAMFKHSWHL